MMKTKSFKRGDFAILANTINVCGMKRYAGSHCRVTRAKRDGTLYINIDGEFGSVPVKANDLNKVASPKHDIKIGDIFVSHWGYEQTNIDFFKITGVADKTVWYQQMDTTKKYTGSMIGLESPVDRPLAGTEKTARVIVHNGGQSSFKVCYGSAFKWNGQPQEFTEYH